MRFQVFVDGGQNPNKEKGGKYFHGFSNCIRILMEHCIYLEMRSAGKTNLKLVRRLTIFLRRHIYMFSKDPTEIGRIIEPRLGCHGSNAVTCSA